jgi:hypothetical protein
MTGYTYKIVLKARKELFQAWEWYEDRQEGLGDRFINQVNQKIKLVIQTPKRYPEKKDLSFPLVLLPLNTGRTLQFP